MKEVEFLGRALEDLRSFPLQARRVMGHQIDRIQNGLEPDDWKPMAGVGSGVREIRFRDGDGAWRSIYIAKLPEAVYVLHCFQKKTQKTAQTDIEIARARLGELLARRPRREK